jgi:hypothetical protein
MEYSLTSSKFCQIKFLPHDIIQIILIFFQNKIPCFPHTQPILLYWHQFNHEFKPKPNIISSSLCILQYITWSGYFYILSLLSLSPLSLPYLDLSQISWLNCFYSCELVSLPILYHNSNCTASVYELLITSVVLPLPTEQVHWVYGLCLGLYHLVLFLLCSKI